MLEFNSETKIWSHEEDPSKDFVLVGSCLGEIIFKRFLEADPHQSVEINGDTLEELSMKNIYDRTILVARNLQEIGVKADDKILILCKYNSWISSIIYACFTLGVPFCPLHFMNCDLIYHIDYIEPTIILYDEEYIDLVEQSLDHIKYKSLKHKLVFGVNAENILFKDQDLHNFQPPKISKSPDELLACLMFTSGSTGKPKLVQISHSLFINSINTLRNTAYNSPEDIVVGPSGIRWISHFSRMFSSIFFSSPQVYSGKNFNPKHICEIFEKVKGTSIIALKSFLQPLLDYYKTNKNHNLSSLKRILVGGDTPVETVSTKWKQEFPNLTIIKRYGMTELAGIVSMGGKDNVNGGRIHQGCQVRIVGEEGQNLRHERSGIVYIKLRAPFLKYYKRPEDNRKSFTPDGWLITGDYGKMTKNNYLHIYCRYKDIVKLNGKLLIPNLLEEYINQHPLVNLGIVLGVKDKFAIFIKLVNGDDKDVVDLYLKESKDWDFVGNVFYIDEFKMLSTGKIDKDWLKRLYLGED